MIVQFHVFDQPFFLLLGIAGLEIFVEEGTLLRFLIGGPVAVSGTEYGGEEFGVQGEPSDGRNQHLAEDKESVDKTTHVAHPI